MLSDSGKYVGMNELSAPWEEEWNKWIYDFVSQRYLAPHIDKQSLYDGNTPYLQKFLWNVNSLVSAVRGQRLRWTSDQSWLYVLVGTHAWTASHLDGSYS